MTAVAELLDCLGERTAQIARVVIGDVALEYHHDRGQFELLLPLVHLRSSLVAHGCDGGARRSRTLAFHVIRDGDLFGRAAASLRSELARFPAPGRSIPRHGVVVAGDGGHRCVLEFADDEPYCYFIYDPRSGTSHMVFAESDVKARRAVTETILDVVESHGDLFGFHGSAVSSGDGIVFAGPAGAGKTILTLAAVHAGCRFVADDIALVTPDGHLVHTEHKRLSLRPATLRFLASVGRALELVSGRPDASDGPEGSAYVSDLFGHGVYTQGAPLRGIVLPRFDPDLERPEIEALDPERAIGSLRRGLLLPWIAMRDPAYELTHKQRSVLGRLRRLLASGRVTAVGMRYGPDTLQAVRHVLDHFGLG